MELSYSPSPSLRIATQNYKLSRRTYYSFSQKSRPISSSLGFHSYNPRSDVKNISTKLNKNSFIPACAKAEPESRITKKVTKFGGAFWRFLRPYAIKGTVIASSGLFGRALIENPNLIEWSLVLKALSGFFAIICQNGYNNGINQIYDIEIDKINKPHLPIAAGDLSVESAWVLVVFFAAAGLSVVGFTCGRFLTCLYCLALFFGTAYSAPPLRLKKSTLGTILFLALVRGFLLPFGVYYSTIITLGLPFQWSALLVFITTFGIIICVVIAITKDLSDVEGDSKYEIETLASKIGLRNVAYLGSGLLLLYYVAAILAAIYMPQTFKHNFLIPVHSILALSLIYQTWMLEKANYTKEASLRFYMFIWNLYYAEYIIFPFI